MRLVSGSGERNARARRAESKSLWWMALRHRLTGFRRLHLTWLAPIQDKESLCLLTKELHSTPCTKPLVHEWFHLADGKCRSSTVASRRNIRRCGLRPGYSTSATWENLKS